MAAGFVFYESEEQVAKIEALRDSKISEWMDLFMSSTVKEIDALIESEGVKISRSSTKGVKAHWLAVHMMNKEVPCVLMPDTMMAMEAS